jgi:hypothetical protein
MEDQPPTISDEERQQREQQEAEERARAEALAQREIEEAKVRESLRAARAQADLEEAQARAAEEARIKAAEAAQKQVELEAARAAEVAHKQAQAAEEARIKAAENAREAEEEARIKAAEEVQKLAELEATRAAEEAHKQAQAAEEARMAEVERARAIQEAQKQAELEAARAAEEAQAAEEARVKAAELDAARVAEEARKKAAQEAQKQAIAEASRAETSAIQAAVEEARKRAAFKAAEEAAAEEVRKQAEAEARSKEEAQRREQDAKAQIDAAEARVNAAVDEARARMQDDSRKGVDHTTPEQQRDVHPIDIRNAEARVNAVVEEAKARAGLGNPQGQVVTESPATTDPEASMVKVDSFTDRPDSFVFTPISQDGHLPTHERPLAPDPGIERLHKLEAERDQGPVSPVGSSITYAFRVSDPKVTASGSIVDFAHWVYQVTSSTTNPSWKGKEAKVSRRFNDFWWLRQQLVTEHPGHIVSPLPPKDMQGTVEKVVMSSTSLVDFRQRALTKFLCGLGGHPVLSNSEVLRVFCEGTPDEFEMYKAKRNVAAAAENPGIMERTKKAIKGMVGAGPGPSDKGLDPKWSKIHMYLRKQRDALTVLKAHLDGLVSTRRDTYTTYSEVSQCMVRLSRVELLVDGTEPCPASRDANSISGYTKDMAGLYGEQAMKEMCLVAESIMFYSGMYASALEGLDYLHTSNGLTNHHEAEAKKAQDAFNALSVKNDMNGIKMEASAKHLTGVAEKARAHLIVVEKNFDADIQRMLSSRGADWKHTMALFVELQLSLTRRVQTLEVSPITDPWS